MRMNQDAGTSSPHLDEEMQGQAATHASPGALVIHEIVRDEGETALRRSNGALMWSALAAGLSMGFSFLTQAMLRSGLPDAPWRPLVDSIGYSVGFVIVILGRQQLFTESTLTAMLPVLTRRDLGTVLSMLRLWAIVLAFNLAGSWIFALLLTPADVFQPEVVTAMRALSHAPMDSAFLPTLLKAMFAGWLIATMVWILPSSRSGRLMTVLLVTYVVALGHLSHIIAGSVDSAYAVLTGGADLGAYLWRFLAPTLLGNMLGGVSLVAVVNHAAVAPEIRGDAGRSEA
jgi:formate-nitrite transporter family protein